MRQLARLLALREAQERIREVEFGVAQGAAAKSAADMHSLAQRREIALLGAHAGLLSGEHGTWWICRSVGQAIVKAQEELRPLLEERERTAAEARASLERSRIRSEQIRLLRDKARQEQARQLERRLQAESDDRFAARMHRSF